MRELQAQLDSQAGGQNAAGEAQQFIGACAAFYGEVCRYQNMTDVELLRGKGQADLAAMRTWVRLIQDWAGTMSGRLQAGPMAEVSGDVR